MLTLREPHRLLEGQRRARAAHVHERRRRADVRQLPDRPGRASRSSSRSRSCSTTRRSTRSARSSSTPRSGTSADSSTAMFYEPLPGEWGISPPLTIAAPDLVVTKTGPATHEPRAVGPVRDRRRNTGLGDAWNVTHPRPACRTAPTGRHVRARRRRSERRVFAADGVTPVPGKGALVAGTDFTLTYAARRLRAHADDAHAGGTIGPASAWSSPTGRKLDADTQNGAALTNVAGATQWFNGDGSNRRSRDLRAHADQRHRRHAPITRTRTPSRWRCTATSSRRPSRI